MRTALAILVLVFPLVFGGYASALHLAILVGIYYTVCVGLTLIFGIGGQLSLAPAAFYGLGAYTSALLAVKLGVPVFIGFVAAAVLCGVTGWLLARPLLRLRAVYLAIATLAFGEILITLIRANTAITGGSTGIVELPAPSLAGFSFSTPGRYYYLVWTLALLSAWIGANIVKSRLGLGLRALAESEIGAASCGVHVARYKAWMFTIGAVLPGLAGALFVHYLGFISPDSFTVQFSILIVMILAVGGRDSFLGALIGAVLVTVLPIALASYERYSPLIFGVLFLASVMFVPKGLAGLLMAAVPKKK
ncbi:MAG TPA: branched-chain amino acid ABC transporter permease [Burkholderiales bacterium]|nr:branched-chain amino acid ABC transporter permease [Burkholderiales bacterium]